MKNSRRARAAAEAAQGPPKRSRYAQKEAARREAVRREVEAEKAAALNKWNRP